jgi:hypothetical protein
MFILEHEDRHLACCARIYRILSLPWAKILPIDQRRCSDAAIAFVTGVLGINLSPLRLAVGDRQCDIRYPVRREVTALFSIRRCDPPAKALHRQYMTDGAYVDCYTTVVRGAITHARFVEAFYTTFLFKLERLILFLVLAKTSTDQDAQALAVGKLNAFAAWTVESRAENQLLLCDFQSRSRSWLMIAQEDWEGDVVTHLYFGSVVVPQLNRKTGTLGLGFVFKALLMFHKVYSRALLAAARFRIKNAS